MYYPMPLEISSTKKLKAVEKLVYYSIYDWQGRDISSSFSIIKEEYDGEIDFNYLADKVGLTLKEFVLTLKSLKRKKMLKFGINPEYCHLNHPDCLDEDIKRFDNRPLILKDDEVG